jgi:hypothetical protein
MGVLQDSEMIRLLNPIADKPLSQVLGIEPRMEEDITALLPEAQIISHRGLKNWTSRSSSL